MTDLNDYTAEQALARDLIVTAVNGGINHWARVHGYTVDCPPEQVHAEGIDIADRSAWTVDLDAMTRAVTKLISHPNDCFAPDSRYDTATRDAVGLLLTKLRQEYAAGRHTLLPDDNSNNVIRFAADAGFQVAVADEVIY
jgi:hypothetical protein